MYIHQKWVSESEDLTWFLCLKFPESQLLKKPSKPLNSPVTRRWLGNDNEKHAKP